MRVTDNMRSSMALGNLADLRSKHLKASQEASTGLRVGSPSDDPAAAARLTRIERLVRDGESVSKSLAIGKSDLQLAEGSLAEASDLLKRAKELALAASNGTASAEVRANTAQEIKGIRDALLGLANIKGMRGSIFSGSKTDAPAFDENFAFQGDTYEQTIRSGASSEVTINASGARAFTAAGGRDIFQDLGDLQTALEANDESGIRASLDTLGSGHDQITRERARTGVNLDRIAQREDFLSSLSLLYEKQKADVGGADPAESLTRLVTLEQAVQRSLAVTERILSLDSNFLFGGS